MSNLLKTYGGIGARNVSSTGHVTTRVNEYLYMKLRIHGRASRRRQDLLRRIVAFIPRRGLTCALDPSTRSTTGSKFPDPVMTSVSTRVKAPLVPMALTSPSARLISLVDRPRTVVRCRDTLHLPRYLWRGIDKTGGTEAAHRTVRMKWMD